MDTLTLAVLLLLSMIGVGIQVLPLLMKVPGRKFGEAYPAKRNSPAKAKVGLAFFLLLALASALLVAFSYANGVAPCPARRCDAEISREASSMYWPALFVFYGCGVLFSSMAYYWFRYLRNGNRA